MKKIITIIACSLLLLSCKTKQVTTTKNEVVKTEETKIKHDVSTNQNKAESSQKAEKKEDKAKAEKNETDIEIKGKAETDKPLELHEIENGDTIKTIKVVGQADVWIRSHNSRSEKNTFTERFEEAKNKLEYVSKAVVNEENIKDVAEVITEKTKAVQVTNSTFGGFLSIIVIAIVALLLVFLYIYLRNLKK